MGGWLQPAAVKREVREWIGKVIVQAQLSSEPMIGMSRGIITPKAQFVSGIVLLLENCFPRHHLSSLYIGVFCGS